MKAEEFKAKLLPLREKLFRIAYKMLEKEHDAEDAVQEAYLKLWQLRETLDKYDSVEAFSTVITKNICIDRLRVRYREESMSGDYPTYAAADNPHSLLERSDTHRLIQQIIEQLPPLQRMIIQMKDIEEQEVEEIATITGTNAEAVRMNLSRARKKVREQFMKLNGTGGIR
ncbi:MAG: RNA polymerase sigma factor [Bacteroidales bacterium]|nr:RNA polymerase sigma factor [Bacteroidales bacterium]